MILKDLKFETFYRMGMDFPVLGPSYPSPPRTFGRKFGHLRNLKKISLKKFRNL